MGLESFLAERKKDKDLLLLDIITDQLVGFMEMIVKQRQEFLIIVKNHACRIYKNISNTDDNFEIKYIPSIKKEFKKDNESISKLTELLMISLYMYLLSVIFINIYKLI